MAFSFSFTGDDIDVQQSASPVVATSPARGAFPIAGRPLLRPTNHDLAHLLSRLPSKVAYSCLDVTLDDGSLLRLPRRELWDVRLQLMAEDDGVMEALGDHDVKTGVYEGGFKSWESSVDLVKVLAAQRPLALTRHGRPARIIEMGCGTALPSLAAFKWALEQGPDRVSSVTFILADYNPSVLQLVTLPNLLLVWALHNRQAHRALHDALSVDNELKLRPDVLQAFVSDLSEHHITFFFVSGAWSQSFVQLVDDLPSAIPDKCATPPTTLILGAETIYSPLALEAFINTLLAILERESLKFRVDAAALVAAKMLYFGVGGSLSDFIETVVLRGVRAVMLREAAEGVRRGVVHCVYRINGVA
ncbi:histidine protein methyltransferase 1 [Ophiocordyceps camponoti-floridani]|uniref:protein-histidine N-methyltransferase n=1 Tax=Ophiocordyceps camponoti-floridani TaxID=2030778 RepID=A0A8H4Q4A8_9HYPO|nr:histidine protein methyltransferase 1 [Ophiocordyceps camponoti-floridani]